MPAIEVDPACLLAAVRRYRPDAAVVTGLRPISAGASQEIWSFDVERPGETEGMILRRARHWSETGQEGSAGMAVEAALLQVAAVGGVPVPRVVGVLAPSDKLGDGYLMQRVEGESSARTILRDARFAEARRTLATECGALMARIHRLPKKSMPALRLGWAAEERAHWEAAHRANGTQRPVFELVLRWLADNEPPSSGEPALVHGDFRNGNLMIGPDGVRAVLDWELAHRGDPMEDLGWFCVNSWRFGNVELEAGGLGTRGQLFAGYQAEAGQAVDPERVKYWQVMGTLKWGVTCDAMGLAWRHGSDRSVERLAVARRASETEMDLLHALHDVPGEGVASVAMDAAGGVPSPQALPGSVEDILTEVAAWLRDVSQAAGSPESRFEARIRASLLETLQREQVRGPRGIAEERARLVDLLGEPHGSLGEMNAILCQRIRQGHFRADDAALHAHLVATTLGRLAIDQPSYRCRASICHRPPR